MQIRKLLLSLILIILVSVGVFYFKDQLLKPKITDFKSCMEGGYPILETYPRSCQYSKDVRFVEPLSQEDKKKLSP